MRKFLGIGAGAILLLAVAAAPVSAANNKPNTATFTTVLTTVQLETSGIVPMAAGQWNAGCQLDGYQNGTHEWTYTVWQYFATNGTSITRPLAQPSFSEQSWNFWDYTGTLANPSQTWVTQYTTLATKGNFQFKEIILGQTLHTITGSVTLTTHGNGTWSCASV